MCDNSPDTPFCSPQDGAQLLTGQTVEITWNPVFFTTDSFPSTPSPIFIQADFSIPNNGAPETAGFTSSPLDPSLGTFRWPVLETYLPANSNSTSATLSIAAPLTQFPTNGTFTRIGEGTIRFPGPQVHILRGSVTTTDTTTSSAGLTPTFTPPPTTQDQQRQQPPQPPANPTNPLAIALPIALGLFTALAMISYALLKRRRPDLLARFFPRLWPTPDPSPRGRGVTANQGADKGYGPGQWPQSRGAQKRVRLRGRDVEIRVVRTDLEGLRANAVRMAVGDGERGMGMGMAMGRAGGERGNVFREEVRRQEVKRDVIGGRV